MRRMLEEYKIVQSLIPATRAAATVEGALGGTSGWIDTMIDGELCQEAIVLFEFGAIAAGVTPIDASLYHASGTGGAGNKINGTDIVQMAGGDDDNQIASIGVILDRTKVGSIERYIRPHLVLGGTGNTDCSCVVLLKVPKAPATQTVASVLV